MIEVSPALKKIQKITLKCNNLECADESNATTLTGMPVSWHSTLEEVPTGCKDATPVPLSSVFYELLFLSDFDFFTFCAVPTIIIAHEFFDALPVHQFQVY